MPYFLSFQSILYRNGVKVANRTGEEGVKVWEAVTAYCPSQPGFTFVPLIHFCLKAEIHRGTPNLHPQGPEKPASGYSCRQSVAWQTIESESEVTQLCLTLCDPMDCSLPGSTVHGIFQARYWSGLPFPSWQTITHRYRRDLETEKGLILSDP